MQKLNQLRNIFDKISNTQLPKLYKADIPFLSTMALTRMIKKGIQVLKVLSYQRLNKCLGNKLLKHILVTNHLKIFRKIRTRTLASEADIDRLKKQGLKPVKEFKKMSVEIGDDTKRKKAIADLRKKGFEVTLVEELDIKVKFYQLMVKVQT